MVDAQNKPLFHVAIAVGTLLAVLIPWFFMADGTALTGENLRLMSRFVAIVSFVLLFLVMIIGPIMKLFPILFPKWGDFPWNWRAELGIWFAVWAVIHTLFIFALRDWDVIGYILGISPWAFGALVATVMAVILAAISFRGAITFLGPDSWKWLQNYFTYVIWWLTIVHIVDRALIRPGFPSGDPIHWVLLAMVVIVPVLQLAGFIKTVREYRKGLKEKTDNNNKEVTN